MSALIWVDDVSFSRDTLGYSALVETPSVISPILRPANFGPLRKGSSCGIGIRSDSSSLGCLVAFVGIWLLHVTKRCTFVLVARRMLNY